MIAVDRPDAGLGALAHRTDPEPALRIRPPVVRAGLGPIGLDRHDLAAGAALQAEVDQRGFRRDQEAVGPGPACGRGVAVKAPAMGILADPAEQTLVEDVEPEKLRPLRMPKRAFAQFAQPVVEDPAYAACIRAAS